MKKFLLACFLIFLSINCYAMEEAILKNIKVDNKLIECAEMTCYVEVDGDEANISYEVSEGASVDHESPRNIKNIDAQNGSKAYVTVTNGDITNMYEFIFTKRIKSSDTSLKSVSINSENIELTTKEVDGIEEQVNIYNVLVPYNVTEFKFDVLCNDSNASVTSNLVYNLGIDDGNGHFEFSVKAEDGTKRNYNFIIRRESSPNVFLKSLNISGKDILVSDNVFEYDLSVEYSITNLDVKAIFKDSNCKYEVVGDSLIVGDNVVKIIVTNSDYVREYIINVTREENIDKSIVSIYSMCINNIASDLNFYPDVLSYNVKVYDSIDKLDFDIKLKDSTSSYEIVNNSELVDNSVVLINVSNSIDDIKRTYEIKVNVINDDVDNNKTLLFIVGGFIIFSGFVMILVELKFKKKKVIKNNIINSNNNVIKNDVSCNVSFNDKSIRRNNIDFNDLEEI